MSKIFVNVCSFRDPLLSKTIESLLETESGRNKITYGIFEQTKLEESLMTVAPHLVKHPQVRYKRIDPEYSEGVVWARGINALQITDEQFQYQIDSHMLFDKAWDNYLIFDYNQAKAIENTEKIILTCGTKNFQLKDNKIIKHTLTKDITVKIGYYRFDKHLKLYAHGPWIPATEVVTPSIHICAGNFFTTTQWVRDVGYDSRIFFSGEEQYMMLKSFVAGYKTYHQTKIKVYHYILSSKHVTKHTIDPVHSYEKLQFFEDRTWKTINDYIYSLDQNILEEYRKKTGVDYINRKLEQRAITDTYPLEGENIENDWAIPDRL